MLIYVFSPANKFSTHRFLLFVLLIFFSFLPTTQRGSEISTVRCCCFFFNRLFITIYYCFLQPQTKDSIVKPKYRAIKQYSIFWLPACICFYVLFSLLILINTVSRSGFTSRSFVQVVKHYLTVSAYR